MSNTFRDKVEHILVELVATVHEAVVVRNDTAMRERAYKESLNAIIDACLEALPEKKHYGTICKSWNCSCMYTPRNDAIDQARANFTSGLDKENV